MSTISKVTSRVMCMILHAAPQEQSQNVAEPTHPRVLYRVLVLLRLFLRKRRPRPPLASEASLEYVAIFLVEMIILGIPMQLLYLSF